MSLEIWSFVVDVLSLIATVVLTVAIYWYSAHMKKNVSKWKWRRRKKLLLKRQEFF